jgi:signal transduction histidine kinase
LPAQKIRTPLNAVLGLADLLADSELDAQQQEWLELIKIAGNVHLSLIGKIKTKPHNTR